MSLLDEHANNGHGSFGPPRKRIHKASTTGNWRDIPSPVGLMKECYKQANGQQKASMRTWMQETINTHESNSR